MDAYRIYPTLSYEEDNRSGHGPHLKWIIAALAGITTLLLVGVYVWLTTPPTCSDMAPELRQAQQNVSKGNLAVAIGIAEGALEQTPPPCDEPRTELLALWYSNSLQELFSAPPDRARETPAKWLDIEQKATEYEVPAGERRTPLWVAQQAYSAKQWHLANAAFNEAWVRGDAGSDPVTFGYAIKRNLGAELADVQGKKAAALAKDRNTGIEILCSAQALATRNGHIELAEATGDLLTLELADCSKIPVDGDPVLKSPPGSGSFLARPAGR